MAGRRRCRLHGGLSFGGNARIFEFRRAWLERMKAGKAAGFLEKLPGGWTKGVPRKRERIVAKALTVLATAEAELVAGDGGLASELEEVTRLGLGKVREVLEFAPPEEAEPVVRFAMLGKQAEIGLQLIRAQIRRDSEVFRRQSDDRFISMLERLEEAKLVPVPTIEPEATD